jgi:hypothetical protein
MFISSLFSDSRSGANGASNLLFLFGDIFFTFDLTLFERGRYIQSFFSKAEDVGSR